MYEYIKGIFKGMNRDYIIIENNNIGYKIYTSGNTLASMPKIDEEVKLHLQQIVREDFLGLYGFYTKEERDMFNILITINGVGAKASLALLSITSITNLKYAILTSDEKTLTKAPGIGKKTAQRIILELKDKFKNDSIISNINIEENKGFDLSLEALDALIALGYSEKEANKALKSIDKNNPLETIIKDCLKFLMN
ncbi:Holliday junction DNA helicase RuvA [Clostridium tetanomorphum]|uniref:Holliday junction branch migration complex subunit RuvA n=1 Tax=Clostridium tetanomorphum TaxID=1553 RepID=A0A923EA27_CLOTT|nr:Holliday junction branch migration protein RuvA [Clostridium tetanomorphum]KAJ53674.1 Holliday junction DNA helicase RuvA [Clostridium tetanomorphum DSM 665]MBC2397184.1 Holliday junction branch migration protein RuvA [Clostridium tetanomorphum]MBP1862398.1 Holliday junction DNA helicase RuvA [Clostridium tetanomorphum]NRS85762.1 Holliday junction DNA helicase RuvA [Clostridium tetanomorphum]NRZ96229.1 Holliday junction DNA helicase RuvA [Clostridium tetanomorphum]